MCSETQQPASPLGATRLTGATNSWAVYHRMVCKGEGSADQWPLTQRKGGNACLLKGPRSVAVSLGRTPFLCLVTGLITSAFPPPPFPCPLHWGQPAPQSMGQMAGRSLLAPPVGLQLATNRRQSHRPMPSCMHLQLGGQDTGLLSHRMHIPTPSRVCWITPSCSN